MRARQLKKHLDLKGMLQQSHNDLISKCKLDLSLILTHGRFCSLVTTDDLSIHTVALRKFLNHFSIYYY